MHSAAITPARSIDDDTHQTSRNDAGNRQSDEPAHVDPSHKAPVDGPPCARAKTNTDSSARNTLRSRHRQLCKSIVVSKQVRPMHRHSRTKQKKKKYLLNRVAKITVTALPNSIENPLLGLCSVMRLPKFLIMLYPYVHRPITKQAPPNTNIHTGTSALPFSGSAPSFQSWNTVA